MSYTPRTTQPTNDDLRWRSQSHDGYNNFPCVYHTWGSVTPYDGSVLANCTGYCAGRWMEIGNTNTPYAFSGNAKEWYNEAQQAGYSVGSEPKLGAIVVFDGWSTNTAGHVGIVEALSDDGSYILCSESNWTRDTTKGYFEYPVTRYRSTGWKRSGSSSGAAIGFIYHPNVTPEPVIPEYNIYIYKGSASKTKAKEGETITITAEIPKGEHFQRWVTQGITLQYPAQRITSFTMPANDVYITALTKENKFPKKGYIITKGCII